MRIPLTKTTLEGGIEGQPWERQEKVTWRFHRERENEEKKNRERENRGERTGRDISREGMEMVWKREDKRME